MGSTRVTGVPALRRLRRACDYAALDGPERLVSSFYWLGPDAVRGLLAPELRSALADGAVAEPLISALDRLPEGATDLDRMLYLEGKFFLADHNLNYTDTMSMAHGVEVRVPLLDQDRVALAARLPDGMTQRGRTGTWIFKQAMEPYLPLDVIDRPKTGFGAPLRRWLRHELRELLDDWSAGRARRARRARGVGGAVADGGKR